MKVLDRIRRTIESHTKSDRNISKASQKATHSAPDLINVSNNAHTAHIIDTNASQSGKEIVTAKDIVSPIKNKINHIQNQTDCKAQLPSSKLMENWSAYMTNMGTHFRQIAEESLFRSQYLTMNTADPVYFLII